MEWFDEEFESLKKKMKWNFRDLSLNENKEGVVSPLINVKETGRELIVKAKLPGVSRRDVSVKVADDSLEICADSVRKDKSHIRYFRELTLPAMVDHKNSQIGFKEGLLMVRIPKIKRKILLKLRKN